ncbi:MULTISPECIES: hypothetical protein [Bradyrhizobium]|uniref:Uncharacterized protein n=1 Tax=Bradyrhizobium diazoefficiens TaxID=1355477 RepID=A0A810AGG1_9BRAD|nr:hypothetical protein [Bradyrhizobium diazoefficiens]MBP1060757.1 hypothetical protein [Bradyrhizobium japonicum]AWO87701.1 hypothetical protein DI395_03390 [Bradyrhizobium diazoefficiens]BBZ90750.1 hypothetical protein F07S3_05830 [Bradyrhizobium diazoefficiens]BCA08736.1 hypothetical protein BDHF08_05830 [Bradyrhizobium diazoefficiens]BCE53072.1 hypothetical protein XF5B_05840 [Bradyrhizobium diazoefficiens]
MWEYDTNEWRKDLQRGVSDQTIRDIVADGRRPNPNQLSSPVQQDAGTSRAATGQDIRDWRPPGLAVADRIIDRFAPPSAAELEARERRARATQAANRIPLVPEAKR